MGSAWDDWRAEQDEVARDAAIVRRHALDIRARLREAMARGDRVAIEADGVRAVGLVIEVDHDLLSLRSASGRIDVRLDPVPRLVLRVIEIAAGPGQTPPLSSGGWRGRLLAAEASGVAQRVDVCGADVLEGRVLVGLDHIDVVAADAAVTTITLAMVTALRPSAP